jgi:hypothetical protein
MATEIVANLSPAYLSKRRSIRYKLDVPLRVIVQKEETTLVRDGRGTELSECGMFVMARVELGVGEEVEIEFTLPYSGEPIRVSGVVRNRNGYRHGCEFIGRSWRRKRAVCEVLADPCREKVVENGLRTSRLIEKADPPSSNPDQCASWLTSLTANLERWPPLPFSAARLQLEQVLA